MALTVALVKDLGPVGAGYEAIVDITGDASYPTGGEVTARVDLATMCPRLQPGTFAEPPVAADAAKITGLASERNVTGHMVSLDRATAKILFWAIAAEVANLTNLSAVTVRARVRYGQVS